MKYLKLIPIFLFVFVLSTQANVTKDDSKNKATAESVFAFAKSMEKFDQVAFRVEANKLSLIEKTKLIKLALEDVKASEGSGKATIGEYILAVIIPPVAVGLHTGWEARPVISNVLWTILGWVPGVVHAIIVLER